MGQPKFRRYWIRILPDGSALPQFDPRTGKYCGYEAYEGPVAQVLFYPVTPRLAELIKKQGDEAEPSNLPVLIFDVPHGCPARMNRAGTLRLDPWHICGFCGAEFESFVETCPRCLTKNQWYCGKCDKLIEKPLVKLSLRTKENGRKKIFIPYALVNRAQDVVRHIPGGWIVNDITAFCPICETRGEPRGLRYLNFCIGDFTTERHFTHYVLSIGNEKHIILDYKRVQ